MRDLNIDINCLLVDLGSGPIMKASGDDRPALEPTGRAVRASEDQAMASAPSTGSASASASASAAASIPSGEPALLTNIGSSSINESGLSAGYMANNNTANLIVADSPVSRASLWLEVICNPWRHMVLECTEWFGLLHQ